MANQNENDDPCDPVTSETLSGWIHYDSSGMRSENTRQRLEGDSGDRYQDSWIRFDNG